MAEQHATAQAPPTLAVVVLTLNEASRIQACLRSAAFAHQIVVVDSGSTDGTPEQPRHSALRFRSMRTGRALVSRERALLGT